MNRKVRLKYNSLFLVLGFVIRTLWGLGIIVLLDHCSNEQQQGVCTGEGRHLLAATTTFSEGSLSIVNLDNQLVCKDILTPHHDMVLRKIDEQPYIINRFGSNNITRLDRANNYSVSFEQSTGTNSNPHDIAKLEGGLGIVSLYDTDHLSVFDLESGNMEAGRQVDISTYNTNGDGKANLSALCRHADSVYASIQDLDDLGSSTPDPNDFSVPNKAAKLIKINAVNLAVTPLEGLPLRNPVGDLSYYRGPLGTDSDQDWLITAAVGAFGSYDGGIVAYNITTNTYKTLLTESQAGDKDILDAMILSETRGFVILLDSSFKNSLAAFDPGTGELESEALLSENVGTMLHYDGRLYVGDRTPTNPGIRIFDPETLVQETVNPINVGLPPISMIVIEP